jgi:phosphatidylserine synthase 2
VECRQAHHFVTIFYVELPERSYGADCRIYTPENPKGRFNNVYVRCLLSLPQLISLVYILMYITIIVLTHYPFNLPSKGNLWLVNYLSFLCHQETLFDEFVLAHVLGWWGKATMIRNQALLWLLSIGFEMMEVSKQMISILKYVVFSDYYGSYCPASQMTT